MTILCYGDSNTFGYDPRNYFGGRYHAPWPELLASMTNWRVRNCGSCGREIPRRETAFPNNMDLLIVMLGTNDLLQGCTAIQAAARMESFLTGLKTQKILLIAPPPMCRGEWVSDAALIRQSVELSSQYRVIADNCGIRFLDAGAWGIPMSFDGVHFTQDGHRIFAEALERALLAEETAG